MPAPSHSVPVRSEFADDPDFQELLGRFFESLQQQRREIVAALDLSHWEEVARKAHQLKGAGGGYGFPGLSETARRLEEVCKTQNAAAIASALEDLLAYLDRILPA